MKQSAKAKRLAKHHKRFGATSQLNLVALMDIFTILVFFLMVNQSDVRVLQSTKEIKLPVSLAEELPAENLIITLLPDNILVQERAVLAKGKAISSFTDKESTALINALKKELSYQSNKRNKLTKVEQEKGRAVTIIGDATLPYSLLKQIMAACADSDYRNMSLAVERVSKSSQGGS